MKEKVRKRDGEKKREKREKKKRKKKHTLFF